MQHPFAEQVLVFPLLLRRHLPPVGADDEAADIFHGEIVAQELAELRFALLERAVLLAQDGDRLVGEFLDEFGGVAGLGGQRLRDAGRYDEQREEEYGSQPSDDQVAISSACVRSEEHTSELQSLMRIS